MLKTSRPAVVVRRPALILAAAILVLCPFIGVSRAQSDATLTNDDVVKMVRAQLSTSIIRTAIDASNATFDLSPAGLIALKDAGVSDDLIAAMQSRMKALARAAATGAETRTAPEKSEMLADSKDPDFILRNFRTMLVDASGAGPFGSEQMKAALGRNKDFQALRITIVDDPAVADAVLKVTYTFAWDYPFSLKHQNTSMVLLSGKGSGPFSGPKGAASVASELAKLLKPYRLVKGS